MGQQVKRKSDYNQIEETEEMFNIPNGIIKMLKDDIAEIKTALLGNEYQHKGLIERVKDLEEEVYKLKKLKWTVYGGATIVASLVTLLLRFVFQGI
mgnify:CR=1 FL=1